MIAIVVAAISYVVVDAGTVAISFLLFVVATIAVADIRFISAIVTIVDDVLVTHLVMHKKFAVKAVFVLLDRQSEELDKNNPQRCRP